MAYSDSGSGSDLEQRLVVITSLFEFFLSNQPSRVCNSLKNLFMFAISLSKICYSGVRIEI